MRNPDKDINRDLFSRDVRIEHSLSQETSSLGGLRDS